MLSLKRMALLLRLKLFKRDVKTRVFPQIKICVRKVPELDRLPL